MVLVIDNYDSFVHNLARYFRILGAQTLIVRNDKITIDEIKKINPSHIVLSPGPCTPSEAGICIDVVKYFAETIPMLGVCLGHQAIAQAFGSQIIKASYPMHGKSSLISHDGSGVFHGIPDNIEIGRYHSLVVQENGLDVKLKITARTDDGTIMSLTHKEFPVWGVQFHPESVLTQHGLEMINNFLAVAS